MDGLRTAETEVRPEYAIIVHCHLRWDFVWQRPQHLISRLSRFHPILFLEDAVALPEISDGVYQPRMEVTEVSPSLTVARPMLRPHVGNPKQDEEIDKLNGPAWYGLLDNLIRDLGWRDAGLPIVHWFYTPMAVGARELFDPIAISYDCMDELANFKGAPKELKDKETALMAAADVVFTGGPSMYVARKDKHPNVHQFNSGVDVEHFRKALDPATKIPDDIARLSHPVLLYYGVIDERMGWENIAAVCDAHPEWSVVMVGPLAKIGEDDLLRRPNLHYTGQRGYNDLPGYLKGADVTLVPFALSDATRYLSPTKTLEYFAAHKPVVATPIQDMVDHYADAVRIAYSPAEFVQACEAALSEDNTTRLENGARYAQANTWDNIALRMRDLLDEAVAKNMVQQETAQGASPPGDTPSAAGGQSDIAIGQVRWYSGSRGAGVVETGDEGEVMAFLPGEAQEDLGSVREGDAVAVGVAGAGPAHVAADENSGANIFPLGLDKLLKAEEQK